MKKCPQPRGEFSQASNRAQFEQQQTFDVDFTSLWHHCNQCNNSQSAAHAGNDWTRCKSFSISSAPGRTLVLYSAPLHWLACPTIGFCLIVLVFAENDDPRIVRSPACGRVRSRRATLGLPGRVWWLMRGFGISCDLTQNSCPSPVLNRFCKTLRNENPNPVVIKSGQCISSGPGSVQVNGLLCPTHRRQTRSTRVPQVNCTTASKDSYWRATIWLNPGCAGSGPIITTLNATGNTACKQIIFAGLVQVNTRAR